jgi:hypothetical protein
VHLEEKLQDGQKPNSTLPSSSFLNALTEESKCVCTQKNGSIGKGVVSESSLLLVAHFSPKASTSLNRCPAMTDDLIQQAERERPPTNLPPSLSLCPFFFSLLLPTFKSLFEQRYS